MIVKRAFKFRLHPSKSQARLLQQALDECRWLYNQLLEQRKLAYEELSISLTKYQQLMFLPEMKLERPDLNLVYSQVVQNVVDRLDKSFQGFYRRCKSGEKPGFPRFRGYDRYDSFCYPQSGFALTSRELKLSKIGCIRIRMHRPVKGTIKTCTIHRTAAGHWDVTLACEMEAEALPAREESVGIDMGLETFATLSDGGAIANPRFFKKDERALAAANRKMAKTKKGSLDRKKRRKAVARIHERIKNRRNDFCHQESRKIVAKYQNICMEDLNIKKMIEGSYYAKSITDASWNQFCRFLSYKAEEAGRKMGWANPAYTTQTCSQCGYREKKKLSERQHLCAKCGYQAGRDFNASQNILALGLDGLGAIPRSPRLQARE